MNEVLVNLYEEVDKNGEFEFPSLGTHVVARVPNVGEYIDTLIDGKAVRFKVTHMSQQAYAVNINDILGIPDNRNRVAAKVQLRREKHEQG